MASLAAIRAQHPEYNDLTDQQLADGLYKKFYSDMPRAEFDQKVGLQSDAPPAGAVPGSAEYAQWAVQQAKAGKTLPQVSKTEPTQNGILDKIDAAYTSAVNAVPIAGPKLLEAVQGARGAVQHMTPEQVQAETAAKQAANPIASTAGGVTGTVLPFIAGGAIPGVGRLLGMTGNLATRAFMGGLSGAGINAADTIARGGSGNDAETSALIGGAVGGALPILGAGLRRLVTPLPMNAGQRAAAATMDREGVTLSAGQRSGSKKLRYIESELGGGAADALQERQGREFTRAVLSRAGISADSAEPQVIDEGFRRVGKQFDDLAGRNSLQPDRELLTDLQTAWHDYAGVTGQSQRAPIIANTLRDIAEKAQTKRFVSMDEGDKLGFEWSWSRAPDKGMAAVKFGDKVFTAKTHQEALQQAIDELGDSARVAVNANPEQHLGYQIVQSRPLDGAFYKALRSRLDRAARMTKDPELMGSLRDIMGALDQAMERSIGASNPDDLGAWQAVRQQYKNLLVIEKAATGAGEQAASGVITPARLRSAAINQNRRAYARGRNDFTELANAGVQTMTPLPQSGTAPRLAARAFGAIPAAIGGLAGAPGGIPGALVGAAAGAALPAIAGRAVLSRAGRAVLTNQMLPGLSERALLAPAALPQIVKDKKPVQITVRGGR